MDILTVLISLIYEHRIFYLFMSSSVSFIKVMWFSMYRSFISLIKYIYWDFPGGTSGKELAFQCRRLRDPGSIPGSGRSPGEGHGNPLQYSCLENPMDGGALQAMVCRVTRGWTWLKWLITTAQIILFYFGTVGKWNHSLYFFFHVVCYFYIVVFSCCLLLLYRKANAFWMLIFYPVLNLLTSCNSFW